MNPRLLDILVCPICKATLSYDKNAQELICQPEQLAYPVRDGIPVLWVDEARDMRDMRVPASGSTDLISDSASA